MRVAASRDLESFADPIVVPTPSEYQSGIETFTEAAKKAAAGEQIETASVGLPGSFDRDRKVLEKAGNLPSWSGARIGDDIASALGAAVHIENDVSLVGLGEAHYGAGQGADILAYMTVSTGVNAARIVDGKIDRSLHGFETGGQCIFHDGRFVEFEQLVSGKAIEKKYGKHPKALGLGHPVWEELAETVALGLYNTILHWSPEKVVLGGSMFNTIGIPVERVAAHLSRINKKYSSMPAVEHSALGDFGGLYGGLARLRHIRA